MSLHILLNLFFSGMILGSSVCAIYCGWIFLPFVFDKNHNIKKAISRFIMFHSGKIVSYTILGSLVGYSTSFISQLKHSRIPLLIGAIFFFILGILNFVMPEKFVAKMKKGFVGFSGLLVAFIPCGALLGVLVYLAYVANDILTGALGGFVFGLGNAVNPLIILAIFSPRISRLSESFIKKTIIFKTGASFVFVSWSMILLWRAFQ
ncbi:MAG: sulfite exporter TauE/SafE family protein [Candidatus Omnitrophica bacterium]|nr:sulfite exporter TauE/SafE family protein [Candidatus Omnitrophota bacterium]MCM8817366.1 sulfite exporter TauE/SafE family protein [Candidatus Omnitrophota bacterium]